MTRVHCLAESTKDQIVGGYLAKYKLKTLAEMFGTSSRTIGRVLEERGLATPVPRLKGEAYAVMQLLKQHNLDIAGLVKLLTDKPVIPKADIITPATVQTYLNGCTRTQLAKFFHISDLVKMAEDVSSLQHEQIPSGANEPTFQPQSH